MTRRGLLLPFTFFALCCGPSTAERKVVEHPVPPPALLPALQVQRMEEQLTGLAGSDSVAHATAYAELWQRARDGDRAARTVQLVFGLLDAMRDGCSSTGDSQSFAQELDLSLMQLTTAPPAEWVFAGPAVLLSLHAAGRQGEQPKLAERIVAAGRKVFSSDATRRDQGADQNGPPRPDRPNKSDKPDQPDRPDPATQIGQPGRLGELLADVVHALRLGCHLQMALPLQEEAVKLLEQAPGKSEAALLARRDLATLHFLLGDGTAAQHDLGLLDAALGTSATTDDLAARREVVQVLRSRLIETQDKAPAQPPPRETGPGWQVLRTVQQEASCPDATPADAHLLRVPVPPPPCAAALPAPTPGAPETGGIR